MMSRGWGSCCRSCAVASVWPGRKAQVTELSHEELLGLAPVRPGGSPRAGGGAVRRSPHPARPEVVAGRCGRHSTHGQPGAGTRRPGPGARRLVPHRTTAGAAGQPGAAGPGNRHLPGRGSGRPALRASLRGGGRTRVLASGGIRDGAGAEWSDRGGRHPRPAPRAALPAGRTDLSGRDGAGRQHRLATVRRPGCTIPGPAASRRTLSRAGADAAALRIAAQWLVQLGVGGSGCHDHCRPVGRSARDRGPILAPPLRGPVAPSGSFPDAGRGWQHRQSRKGPAGTARMSGVSPEVDHAVGGCPSCGTWWHAVRLGGHGRVRGGTGPRAWVSWSRWAARRSPG